MDVRGQEVVVGLSAGRGRAGGAKWWWGGGVMISFARHRHVMIFHRARGGCEPFSGAAGHVGMLLRRCWGRQGGMGVLLARWVGWWGVMVLCFFFSSSFFFFFFFFFYLHKTF